MDRPKIALEAIIILGTGTFGLQWFNGGGALAWEVEVGHSRQAGDSLRYTVSKYLWRLDFLMTVKVPSRVLLSIKLVLFSNEPTHHHKLNSTVNNNNTFSKGAEVY
ncbi:unnamed protein product [Fusarium graminearum]|uniref:Chromosome 1, complete genome n=2 Tax=Gibberella zeae TaxID=5518 RepID=I1RD13_GIBZE|nr:hypothetical protein FGSG_01500 [Fusarium graminearum PH-1]CAF3592634.1 unnamed protein product [Fusarium graminearum]ESU06824.1 hypothetical protein FGSG_01500 [Fusarium graminearum PH-1]CAF3599126.1 unnamed protein product [Fusarium graminearum]CAG1981073.1 unnamed protein product [Fusarium graminearum]CAG1983873.1 unnamed protein product [Fusarium graminearum]|eukprot:XP_011317309.1 hypothetical protein FGSG_01500 [Fusarium graminearum PH-1]